MCCSVLQCVAVCCSRFPYKESDLSCLLSLPLECIIVTSRVLTSSVSMVGVGVLCVGFRLVVCEAVCITGCCSVLQCVAGCCSVLRCVAVCCSVLQCVAVCCSVLQCVAVCVLYVSLGCGVYGVG